MFLRPDLCGTTVKDSVPLHFPAYKFRPGHVTWPLVTKMQGKVVCSILGQKL